MTDKVKVVSRVVCKDEAIVVFSYEEEGHLNGIGIPQPSAVAALYAVILLGSKSQGSFWRSKRLCSLK